LICRSIAKAQIFLGLNNYSSTVVLSDVGFYSNNNSFSQKHFITDKDSLFSGGILKIDFNCF